MKNETSEVAFQAAASQADVITTVNITTSDNDFTSQGISVIAVLVHGASSPTHHQSQQCLAPCSNNALFGAADKNGTT
jgi:hypothetical protein